MAEYYGVVRAKGWVEHSMVGVKRGPYKNSKFIAKINTPSGKARYIYDQAELAAYKGNKSKATGEFAPMSKNSKKKKKNYASWTTTAKRGPSGVTSGALTYRGENDPELSALLPAPQDPLAKKKKKKKKSKVTATFTRIR